MYIWLNGHTTSNHIIIFKNGTTRPSHNKWQGARQFAACNLKPSTQLIYEPKVGLWKFELNQIKTAVWPGKNLKIALTGSKLCNQNWAPIAFLSTQRKMAKP